MTMMRTIHQFVGDCSVVFDWLKSALPLPKGTGLAASAGHFSLTSQLDIHFHDRFESYSDRQVFFLIFTPSHEIIHSCSASQMDRLFWLFEN
jgi:hypothetical protein